MQNFAIIGCGSAAKLHAEQISRVGKLVAVCDIVPERANLLAGRFNAKAWYSIDEFLKNDNESAIVCICTPNGCHAEHVIKSLQADKHAICESPLCLTAAGAWQILETEKFSRKRLAVVNLQGFYSAINEVKNGLGSTEDNGAMNFHLNCQTSIREENFKEWKGRNFPGGGALYTVFSSHIAAMTFLLGAIDQAVGFSANFKHAGLIEFEDTGVVSLQMKNGSIGTINWSLNGSATTESSLRICTGEKSFVLSARELDSSGPGKYAEVYDSFMNSIDSGEGRTALYESVKAVEATEKIYKALHQIHPDN